MPRFQFFEIAATVAPDNPGEAWLVGEADGRDERDARVRAMQEHGEPNPGTIWAARQIPAVAYLAPSGRVYWRLPSGAYQVTPDGTPPQGDSGYGDLGALCRLKGDRPPMARPNYV